MNQAHTVPPIDVPKTSAENAPDGETGRQPAPPGAPNVAGVGDECVAIGEETLEELVSDGVQPAATTTASTVAIAPRDVRVSTISSAYTPGAPRRFGRKLGANQLGCGFVLSQAPQSLPTRATNGYAG